MRTTFPSLFRATNALNPGHRPKGSGLTGFGLRTTSCSPCRSLAQFQSNRDIFPEMWLPSSTPPRQHSGAKYEDAPPDERTLKLGKSMFQSVTLQNNPSTDFPTRDSLTHATISSAQPPSLPSSTRNTLTSHHPSPFPFDPPSPPHSLRPRRLPCSSMDGPYGLGPRPHRWQCQAHYS